MSHNEAGSWAWVPADEAAASPTRQPAEAASLNRESFGLYTINGTRSIDVLEFLIDQDEADFYKLMNVVSFRRNVRYGRTLLFIRSQDL